jgi:adenosylhomocysteinase
MPVVAELGRRFSEDGSLKNLRIAADLIVEPKTSVLLLALHDAGAEVSLLSGGGSGEAGVAGMQAQIEKVLQARGIHVFKARGTREEAREAGLRLLDSARPQLIIDDGANLLRLLIGWNPELAENLIGVAEETSSGVWAAEQMHAQGRLPIPVVAVNDSRVKTGFDNRHGTSETVILTLASIMERLDVSTVVVGFGAVGGGVARRMRGIGAQVVVAETDPVAALSAVFEGFEVLPLDEAVASADLVISATGQRHTIEVKHLANAKAETVFAVAGGVDQEIALEAALEAGAEWAGPEAAMRALRIQGKDVLIAAGGDGVNYTVGPGNPIEVMDLSFGAQLQAVRHLISNKLEPGVHRLPGSYDEEVAAISLQARGFSIDEPKQPTDWRLTRFGGAK